MSLNTNTLIGFVFFHNYQNDLTWFSKSILFCLR